MDYPMPIDNKKPRVRLSRYEMTLIDQILAYIDLHYKDDLSTEQLAAEADLDIRKLRAGVKRRTGFQVHDYHFRVRVEKAKALLLSTAQPLKMIARSVGFKNESHFCQKFRQFTTLTPNEFRFLPEEAPAIPPSTLSNYSFLVRLRGL